MKSSFSRKGILLLKIILSTIIEFQFQKVNRKSSPGSNIKLFEKIPKRDMVATIEENKDPRKNTESN